MKDRKRASSRVVEITPQGRAALDAANRGHLRNEIAQPQRIADEFDQERLRLEAEPDELARQRSRESIAELAEAIAGIRAVTALLERRLGPNIA